MRLHFVSSERRLVPRSFYDGIHAFKGYMRRVFKSGHYPYDWADLNSRERARYARREATARERRNVPRV